MPRKIAGMAMMTIDASIVAMTMERVVLDRATHLYALPRLVAPGSGVCPARSLALVATTPKHSDYLLVGNY
jgi:hypothetical protein